MEARKNSGDCLTMTNGSITISPPDSTLDYIRSHPVGEETCNINLKPNSPSSNNSNTNTNTNKIHIFSQHGNGDVLHHHHKYSKDDQQDPDDDDPEEWTELNNSGDSSLIGNSNTNTNSNSSSRGVTQRKVNKNINIKSDGDKNSSIGKQDQDVDIDNNVTGEKENEALLENDKKDKEDGTEDFGLHAFGSCAKSHLLRITDMPHHLQFNKFVHTGYRRLHDFWGCFCSLFYLHNETVNIFTHVIPIVWVLVYWREMYPWDEIRGNTFLNILGWSHVVASISPWLGSVCYHLFMNHERGARIYQKLLQIDMFGIWVTECFGALTNLSASTWCLPGNLQTLIIILYAVGSIWGLQKALTAWTPMGRRMCFAPVFITRILGFFLRISPYGGGEPSILLHVILQDAVSLLGGMIGVIRVPEIWFPGKLDFFCNSHHIMHVLVVLAVFHMNLATNGDIRWIIGNYSQCAAPSATWFETYSGVLTMFTYSKIFPKP